VTRSRRQATGLWLGIGAAAPVTHPLARVPEPKVEFTSNCDGTVTVKLFNEGEGDATYEVDGVEHALLPGTTMDVPVNKGRDHGHSRRSGLEIHVEGSG